jgi:hypothetical protein
MIRVCWSIFLFAVAFYLRDRQAKKFEALAMLLKRDVQNGIRLLRPITDVAIHLATPMLQYELRVAAVTR